MGLPVKLTSLSIPLLPQRSTSPTPPTTRLTRTLLAAITSPPSTTRASTSGGRCRTYLPSSRPGSPSHRSPTRCTLRTSKTSCTLTSCGPPPNSTSPTSPPLEPPVASWLTATRPPLPSPSRLPSTTTLNSACLLSVTSPSGLPLLWAMPRPSPSSTTIGLAVCTNSALLPALLPLLSVEPTLCSSLKLLKSKPRLLLRESSPPPLW